MFLSFDPSPLLRSLEMFGLGIAASFIGSLAGLGGGFVAIPALRLIFHLPPTLVAGTSLLLVTANVASASVAYWRQGRIEKRIGTLMGCLAIPGSILGAIALRYVSVPGFDLAYAAILLVFSIDLLRRGTSEEGAKPLHFPWARGREFYDALSGTTYRYVYSAPLAVATGLVTGFLSSFFGIGGGIVALPLLLRVFGLPTHIVAGTTHFVILLSAPFGVATHALRGDIDWLLAIPLSLGGLVGAQFGANAARRLSSPTLIRVLGVALLLAAGSLVLQHLI
ncbi:MAG: sulfite exporter TauE/SafE family protein [Vulcanimicrobiaceae bacterium]